MTRTPPLRIDWRFAVGQVILIALGVMLGLAGNAWWGEHQDRLREHAALQRTLTALRTNERLLRQEMYEDSIAWSLNRRVLYHADGIPLDSLRLIADYANWSADARPVLMPFVALFQTGDANVIRDDDLRSNIASYLEELQLRSQKVEAYNQITRQTVERDLPAYMYARVHLAPAAFIQRLGTDNTLRKVFILRQTHQSNALDHERSMLRTTTALRMRLERTLHAAPVRLPAPRLLRDSF